MIKDYWVYQKRNVSTPWALYIVKEYDRRKPDATTLDFTLYHEDIPNATHSHSVVGIQANTLGGFVEEFADVISQYVEFANADWEQLEQSIADILRD